VALAGSFAAGLAFLPRPTGAALTEADAQPPRREDSRPADGTGEGDGGPRPAAGGGRAAEQAPAKPKPAPAPGPEEPLTRADLARRGGGVGRRVTWVGERMASQSARVGKQEGTRHVFKGQGPRGEFTFDLPFIAEEPTPLKRVNRQRTKEELRRDLEEFVRFKQQTGLKGREAVQAHARLHADVVTVTGTITRLDTLIMLGQGTRYDVPVLADVTLTRRQ
jgi:hypothetical protein